MDKNDDKDTIEALKKMAVGPYIPPPMTVKQYAELQGVTVETINNQIRRCYIPTIKIGKRRLINTFALARNCLTCN